MPTSSKTVPKELVACVSDSYDIYMPLHLWGGALRDRVLQRKGTLVIRPDSGEAVTVLEELLQNCQREVRL